ncbi:MAG: hypothetical protein NZM07_09735 [Elioraea sp.]|nr:hypothetical protein [Elioraea sp.]
MSADRIDAYLASFGAVPPARQSFRVGGGGSAGPPEGLPEAATEVTPGEEATGEARSVGGESQGRSFMEAGSAEREGSVESTGRDPGPVDGGPPLTRRAVRAMPKALAFVAGLGITLTIWVALAMVVLGSGGESVMAGVGVIEAELRPTPVMSSASPPSAPSAGEEAERLAQVVAEREREIVALRTEIDALQLRVAAVEEERDRLRREGEGMRRELGRLRGRHGRVEVELDALLRDGVVMRIRYGREGEREERVVLEEGGRHVVSMR